LARKPDDINFPEYTVQGRSAGYPDNFFSIHTIPCGFISIKYSSIVPQMHDGIFIFWIPLSPRMNSGATYNSPLRDEKYFAFYILYFVFLLLFSSCVLCLVSCLLVLFNIFFLFLGYESNYLPDLLPGKTLPLQESH
jgi:hypothetical protein